MNSDPQKAREWQQRGAQKYAERRRTAGRSSRQAKAGTKRPRRNDAPWRREVIALRGEWCRRCGTSRDLQADHVKARGQGGQSVVENGTMLCADCHRLKTERKVLFERSWLDEDQIEWLKKEGWVWWDDEGVPNGRGSRGFARAGTQTAAGPTA